MLNTLILKGQAAKRFGKTHQFNVADLNEMIRAMCSQVKGFKKYLATAHHDGIRFAFFSGKSNVGLEGFDLTRSENTYTMQPIPRGAKSGGFLLEGFGAAVIWGALVISPAGLPAIGFTASRAWAPATCLVGVRRSPMICAVVPAYHRTKV